jgi:hypothetical protein
VHAQSLVRAMAKGSLFDLLARRGGVGSVKAAKVSFLFFFFFFVSILLFVFFLSSFFSFFSFTSFFFFSLSFFFSSPCHRFKAPRAMPPTSLSSGMMSKGFFSPSEVLVAIAKELGSEVANRARALL